MIPDQKVRTCFALFYPTASASASVKIAPTVQHWSNSKQQDKTSITGLWGWRSLKIHKFCLEFYNRNNFNMHQLKMKRSRSHAIFQFSQVDVVTKVHWALCSIIKNSHPEIPIAFSFGVQISWDPNFSGTKFLGEQKSGAQMRLRTISFITNWGYMWSKIPHMVDQA